MLISICGKSGSGKSTLSNELVKTYGKKVIHVDVDKIAHNILKSEEVKGELVKKFGNNILNNNLIDRKKLGKIVFNSNVKMSLLSDITWDFMQKEIDKIIESNKNKIIVLDYILIYKTEYFYKSDIKILLDVPYEIRRDRCMLRDKISEDEFILREKASIDYNENDFDFVLKNSEDLRKVKIYE